MKWNAGNWQVDPKNPQAIKTVFVEGILWPAMGANPKIAAQIVKEHNSFPVLKKALWAVIKARTLQQKDRSLNHARQLLSEL